MLYKPTPKKRHDAPHPAQLGSNPASIDLRLPALRAGTEIATIRKNAPIRESLLMVKGATLKPTEIEPRSQIGANQRNSEREERPAKFDQFKRFILNADCGVINIVQLRSGGSWAEPDPRVPSCAGMCHAPHSPG